MAAPVSLSGTRARFAKGCAGFRSASVCCGIRKPGGGMDTHSNNAALEQHCPRAEIVGLLSVWRSGCFTVVVHLDSEPRAGNGGIEPVQLCRGVQRSDFLD